MLTTVTPMRVWDQGRPIHILAVVKDILVYDSPIVRTLPNVVQVPSDDEKKIAQLEKDGWEYVSSQIKLEPSGNTKGLIRTEFCQYQQGLKLVSKSQYYRRDLQVGFEAELAELPDLTGGVHMTRKQLIQLQCLIRGIDIRQLKQMGVTYGFSAEGLIRTHIGGYKYRDLTIEDWLKGKSRPEIASSRPKDRPVIKLNIPREK